MWDGGPAAPFSGYITKGDHNEVIDQQAGRILGMAKESYLLENEDKFRKIDEGMYLDTNSGLVIYSAPPNDLSYLGLNNGTYAGDGISYLAPVKNDWVIGVVRTRIAYGDDWAKLAIC